MACFRAILAASLIAIPALGQDGPPLLPPGGASAPKPAEASPEDAGPPLSGPLGMPAGDPGGRPSRPIVLESEPTGGSAEPRPLADPKIRTPAPEPPPKPPTGPIRRGRFLDRRLPTPASTARARASGRPGDSVSVEPRSDPAADSALKKKIENQAALAVGDRAREIDVRVVDRSVTIKARVDRFWNRRAVRRSLETLPGLSGYKAKVEVNE